MTTCEHHQSQFLGYLYDLLDSTERQALEGHVAECPACQAALARAREQRRLIGLAARAEFPGVRFEAPVVTAAEPVDAARDERTPWGAWALAASILFLISLSVPAGWWGFRWLTLQREAAVAEAMYKATEEAAHAEVAVSTERVRLLADELRKTEDELQKLPQQYQQEATTLVRTMQTRQLNVILSGPDTVQAGAVNEYQIQTRDPQNQPVSATLTARVRDGENNVVFKEEQVATTGTYKLALPPDLPLRPGDKLSLEVLAYRGDKVQGEVRASLPLAAPVFVTHLATDKPMYRPGETVRFRSLTLERDSLKPAAEELRLVYTVTAPSGQEVFRLDGAARVTKADGQTPVLGPDGQPVRGIGTGDYVLGPDVPGGEYTLKVAEATNRFAAQERKFLVNHYQNPRLNKELDYTRKSYGPGDEVVAACKAHRADGTGPVANRPVTAAAQVDGKPVGAVLVLRTDAQGAVNVRFKLPAAIDRGQATLSVTFDDGGTVETLVRPIPVVLKKLQVEFFPEGGDLVAGVPNRVYFQARTTLDKPAELQGRIVDDAGAVATTTATLHDDREPGVNQGMGAFTFTPQVGKHYELKIDTPAGIEGRYELPPVRAEGVVLGVPAGVGKAGEPVRVAVASAGRDRHLLVGLYCRGRLLDHARVEVQKDQTTAVELKPARPAGGVCRVTVFEEQGPAGKPQLVPRAERLIYWAPVEQLILTAQPDRRHYVPGDKVRLSLSSLNEKEQPAPAVLTVAVVDKSVITMADEKTARSMPTHFYLTSEVRRPEDLEYADVLLGQHPKAPAALDLLLGTQGWRRFAEADPARFRDQKGTDTDRLLVTIGQAGTHDVDLSLVETRNFQDRYARELARLRDQEQKLRQNEERAAAALVKARGEQAERLTAANEGRHEVNRRLAAHADLAAQARALGQGIVAGVLVLAALALVVIGASRGTRRRLLYHATAVCMLLVAGGSYLAPWDQLANTDLADRQVQRDRQLARTLSDLETKARAPRVEDEMRGPRQPATAEALPELGAIVINGNTPQNAQEIERLADEINKAHRFGMMPADKDNAARNDNFFRMMTPPSPAERAGGRMLGLPPGHAAQPLPAGMEPARGRGADPALEVLKEQEQLKREAAEAKPVDFERRDGVKARAAGLGEARKPVADMAKKAGKMAAAADDVRRAQAGLEAQLKLRQAGGLPAGAVPAGKPGALGGAGAGGRGFGRPGFGGGFGMPGLQAPAGGPMPAAGMDARGLLRGDLADRVPPPPAPLVVREYAHVHPTHTAGGPRTDFVDTVFWQPVLVLPSGKADVSFDLCDAVTTYEVKAFGHTADGRLGALTSTVEARLPFYMEPKLPLEVTAGDTIDLPVGVANNTDQKRTIDLTVTPTGLKALDSGLSQKLTLGPDARVRHVVRFQPTLVEGTAAVHLEGGSDVYRDEVLRTIKVVPDGFPIVESKSDVLEQVACHDVPLPATWLPGTLKLRAQVYPSTLADLQKGLEGLLQEPGGCFEQTSTSNYPNLLILDYLHESDQVKPEVEKRARELLARGYQRLVSFECQDPAKPERRGYEWFGGTAPPHEALTAYGLLQFRDMARVYDVDGKMLERTRRYLLAQKDGQGGFKRNPQALDTFGRAPDAITNAYIVWAITESGKDDDVEKELAVLSQQARTSKDPYFLSLVATALLNRAKADDGVALLRQVAAAQQADGHVDAATTSITGSGGRDLQIETTALAVLGWLKANRPADFTLPVQKAVKWIGQQRGGAGAFGSTQSTILSLKALIAFARANKKTAEAGELRLYVGDKLVKQLAFPAGAQEALVLDLDNAEKELKPGKNAVRVEATGKNVFPYTLTWSYRTQQPRSADGCPVKLETKLDRTTAQEGEAVHLSVTVENTQDKGQGMAVAIVGLPAGLSLSEDLKQLKDHARLRNNGTEKGLIGAFEIRGREVVLYWRDLAPKQKIEVPLDLICRVPGQYTGPASRAYLYYNADTKHWVAPLKVAIGAKGE